jgi:hypothetical protein
MLAIIVRSLPGASITDVIVLAVSYHMSPQCYFLDHSLILNGERASGVAAVTKRSMINVAIKNGIKNDYQCYDGFDFTISASASSVKDAIE